MGRAATLLCSPVSARTKTSEIASPELGDLVQGHYSDDLANMELGSNAELGATLQNGTKQTADRDESDSSSTDPAATKEKSSSGWMARAAEYACKGFSALGLGTAGAITAGGIVSVLGAVGIGGTALTVGGMALGATLAIGGAYLGWKFIDMLWDRDHIPQSLGRVAGISAGLALAGASGLGLIGATGLGGLGYFAGDKFGRYLERD